MGPLSRRRFGRFLGAALAASAVTACGEGLLRRSQPSPVKLANVNPWGANTFLDLEVETWKRKKTLAMAAAAGIHWIKQHFPWSDIEGPTQAQFFDPVNRRPTWTKYDEIVKLAEEAGVEIIARVDRAPAWARSPGRPSTAPPESLQDYVAFLTTLALRYRGRIRHYQIWNEPNLAADWGDAPPDPKAYAALLRAASAALKAVDRDIVVISAPMAATLEDSPRALNELLYLERMFEAGAGDWLDVLAANAFGLEYPPEAEPDPHVLNFRRVELTRAVMTEFGLAGKPIWFNEYGWNASPTWFEPAKLVWRRVTEDQQAQWTVRGVEYALANWPWAGVFNIWFLRKPIDALGPDQSEFYFRMVDPDFTPRLVYRSVQKAATGRSSL